jgi:hypothetical protein
LSVVRADPPALADLGAAYASVAARLDEVPVEVRRWAARLGDPELAALARRVSDLVDRVGALATVVRLVAEDLAGTESRVASSFVDVRAVEGVLEGMAPDAVESLLVGAPAVARMVVDAPGATVAGSAAELAAILRSGEPPTVVLRSAAAFLSGLGDRARRLLALLHPRLVAGLASAPVEDRFVANRVLVSAEMARLRERLVAADRAARSWGERRLAWYAELLSHRLLAFDPRGDGRVTEVFGDLATARHLAVYVPGTGTSLDRYQGNAERASSFVAGATDVAVVLWQNADFPDQPLDQVVPPISLWDKPIEAAQHQLRAHVLAAAFRDAADRAGALLTHDVEGLRMAAPEAGSDLTVLGHSYGGSIVGSAEAHGLVADRVVHIASAGAYVSDVRDYAAGECGTRRFSMTAPDDPIQLAQGAGFGSPGQVAQAARSVAGVLPTPLLPVTVPVLGAAAVASGNPLQVGHGLDPDLVPAVTRLDTGLRPDGRSLVSGHGGMFEPGSDAWSNLLAVIRGEPVRVLEPDRWQVRLVPASASLPHYVVTRSPYDAVGYAPPVQPSDRPVCADRGSW